MKLKLNNLIKKWSRNYMGIVKQKVNQFVTLKLPAPMYRQSVDEL